MEEEKQKLIDKLGVQPNAILLCPSKSLWATEGLTMTHAHPKSPQQATGHFLFPKRNQGDRKRIKNRKENKRGGGSRIKNKKENKKTPINILVQTIWYIKKGG